MAVQAEFGESASEAGIRQVEVEPTAPISDVSSSFPDKLQLEHQSQKHHVSLC